MKWVRYFYYFNSVCECLCLLCKPLFIVDIHEKIYKRYRNILGLWDCNRVTKSGCSNDNYLCFYSLTYIFRICFILDQNEMKLMWMNVIDNCRIMKWLFMMMLRSSFVNSFFRNWIDIYFYECKHFEYFYSKCMIDG